MCLHAISNKKPAPEGEGYKVFVLRPTLPCFWSSSLPLELELRSVYFTWSGEAYSQTDWNVTETKDEIATSTQHYRKGFHIFQTLEAAQKMMLDPLLRRDRVILRVHYRGAHTQGSQWPESKVPETVVAESFQVIEGQKITAQIVQGV